MKLTCKSFVIFLLFFVYANTASATPITLHLEAHIDSVDDYFGNVGDILSVATTFDFRTFWDTEAIVPTTGDYNTVGITTDLNMSDIAAAGGWVSDPFSVYGYGTSNSGQVDWLVYFDSMQDRQFSVNLSDMTFFLGSAPVTGYYFEVHGHLNPVPEPSTMLLFGAGIVGLIGYRKKNNCLGSKR